MRLVQRSFSGSRHGKTPKLICFDSDTMHALLAPSRSMVLADIGESSGWALCLTCWRRGRAWTARSFTGLGKSRHYPPRALMRSCQALELPARRQRPCRMNRCRPPRRGLIMSVLIQCRRRLILTLLGHHCISLPYGPAPASGPCVLAIVPCRIFARRPDERLACASHSIT